METPRRHLRLLWGRTLHDGIYHLPVINFHGLRHTNATLLISQQVDVATVSARLGHAQITTTYNFYVHPLKSHDRTAGNVLENLLISSKTN